MAGTNVVTLLGSTTVSADGTTTGDAVTGLHRYQGFFGNINVTAAPAGGAPTLDVYIQASPDGGVTWRDVAAKRFTAAGVQMFQLSQLASGGTSTLAASDAALTSGTEVQGAYGDRLRVKAVAAFGGGTGNFTFSVSGVPVGGP